MEPGKHQHFFAFKNLFSFGNYFSPQSCYFPRVLMPEENAKVGDLSGLFNIIKLFYYSLKVLQKILSFENFIE
jgi:hypothetical protein